MAWLWVLLISMLPMLELKGGIPVGLSLGLGYWQSFCWAFLGSSLICLPLLWLLKPFFTWAKQLKFIGGLFTRIEKVFANKVKADGKTRSGAGKAVAVFLFSLLPLPGAGVWTASFLAVLMSLKFGPAVLSVVGGNLLDALLVLALTNLLGEANMQIFLIVLSVIIVLALIIFFYKICKVDYHKDNDYRD